MQDLWPEITFEEQLDSPVAILKEQAALLGDKTQHIVTAEVRPLGTSIADQFVNGFYLVAPVLENYRYRLFTISYSVDPYPVIFELDELLHDEVKALGVRSSIAASADALHSAMKSFNDAEWPGITREIGQRTLKAQNEQQFVNILQAIFASERTKRIINVLRAQSIVSN
jgi:hypothetical protein